MALAVLRDKFPSKEPKAHKAHVTKVSKKGGGFELEVRLFDAVHKDDPTEAVCRTIKGEDIYATLPQSIQDQINPASKPYLLSIDAPSLPFNKTGLFIDQEAQAIKRQAYDFNGQVIVFDKKDGARLTIPVSHMEAIIKDIVDDIANGIGNFNEILEADWARYQRVLNEQTKDYLKNPTIEKLLELVDTYNNKALSLASKGFDAYETVEAKAFQAVHAKITEIIQSEEFQKAPEKALEFAQKLLEHKLSEAQKKATYGLAAVGIATVAGTVVFNGNNELALSDPQALVSSQVSDNGHFENQQALDLIADNQIPIAPLNVPHTEGSTWRFNFNRFNEPTKAFEISDSGRSDWRVQSNNNRAPSFTPKGATEPTNKTSSNFNSATTQAPAQPMPSYFYLTVDEAKEFAARTIGMPVDLADSIMAIESREDPNALNNDRGSYQGTFACGLYQLMPVGPNTYQEMLWHYGDAMGLNKIFGVDSIRGSVVIDDQVIGHRRDGSNIIGHMFTDQYRERAMEYCSNPYVNTILGSMHMVHKLKITEARMQEKYNKNFDFLPYELAYLNHFLGAREDLVNAYFNTPNLLAKDFVPRSVEIGNRGMFFDRDGNARTVAGMFEHMRTKGNMENKRITDIRDFFWRQSIEEITAKVQAALSQADMVVLANDNNTLIVVDVAGGASGGGGGTPQTIAMAP